MPWNFECMKDVTLKMGGGMGEGPATEVTHLQLNQPVKNFGLFQAVKGCLSCAHVQRSNDNSINHHISNN